MSDSISPELVPKSTQLNSIFISRPKLMINWTKYCNLKKNKLDFELRDAYIVNNRSLFQIYDQKLIITLITAPPIATEMNGQ